MSAPRCLLKTHKSGFDPKTIVNRELAEAVGRVRGWLRSASGELVSHLIGLFSEAGPKGSLNLSAPVPVHAPAETGLSATRS